MCFYLYYKYFHFWIGQEHDFDTSWILYLDSIDYFKCLIKIAT